MESSPCAHNATDDAALVVMGAVGGAATVACVPVVLLVLVLKLYKQLVYRLALYLVLSALTFSAATVLHVAQIPFLQRSNYTFNAHLCQAAAFLTTYTLWTKVLFMLCVTVHLFTYSVFFKNFKKLEAAYVAMSLIVPLLVSAVPLATGSYGPVGEWCWIASRKDNCFASKDLRGYAGMLALWFVPTSLVLVASNGLTVAMVAVLYRRARSGESPVHKAQQMRLLKHMLPSAVYPLSFLLLFLPTAARHIYEETTNSANAVLIFADGSCTAGYGLVAALILLWHILLVLWSRRRWLKNRIFDRTDFTANQAPSCPATVISDSINYTTPQTDDRTVFITPHESTIDEWVHN